ncbi:MAG: hypothetical protein ABSA52_20345 [Candidatus Binatia bacterium]|jgi:hypothetical protein
MAWISTSLHDALIGQRQRVVRLSEDHYLVQWQPRSGLWCVVKMAALDQHGDSCATFRFRKYCEHLELIGQLCSEEKELTSKVAE